MTMDSMGPPVIRLELQRMRYTVMSALTHYTAELDTEVRAAVERYCEPENIRAVVSAEVTQAIDAAVKSEVKAYFAYGGAGRAVIRDAVVARLNEEMGDE
jgi:hypothetical protein